MRRTNKHPRRMIAYARAPPLFPASRAPRADRRFADRLSVAWTITIAACSLHVPFDIKYFVYQKRAPGNSLSDLATASATLPSFATSGGDDEPAAAGRLPGRLVRIHRDWHRCAKSVAMKGLLELMPRTPCRRARWRRARA